MEANVRSMDNGLTPSKKMPKTMLKEIILRLRSKSVLGGVKTNHLWLYVLMVFRNPLDKLPISSDNSVYWLIGLLIVFYVLLLNW